VYHTVKIGTQIWLKENLDVGTMIQGTSNPSNDGRIEKYCYDNNPENCTTYGGLYQWNEAMTYDTANGAKGICPAGWHIPTKTEFETLRVAVKDDGNTLKAIGQGTEIGAGSNASGFSALLGGNRKNNGYFYDLSLYTYFWTSTAFDSTNANVLLLNGGDNRIFGSFGNINLSGDIERGFSIRCLKN
ncbi:MAG: FISUMP domain-containing protein, partial [Ignavibacteria bacterium]|nr:FISUMP domain-containing protein [Ignavibacteria bacterium]